MIGILVGTAILWVASAILVAPLTNLCVARTMAAKGIQGGSITVMDDDQKKYWQGVATKYYILWDVVVLALVGLVGGLLGYFFFGFSWEWKSWPGIIAFIVASLFGVSLTR